MSNNLLQRSNVLTLTNKSGGAVAMGDIVILGTATAKAFTTTTTAAYKNSTIGVVVEPAGIANDAQGKVAVAGWVPKINLNTAASLYDLIKTHTVAKQGTPHAAPVVAGDFAIALQASSTPEAVLYGAPEQIGSPDVFSGEVEDLTTAETDDTLVLAPDGLGGVEFRAETGGGGRTLIAEATPSGTGTVSFTSIPGSYKSLEIEFVARSTKSAVNNEPLNMEFNTDATGANYRSTYSQAYGSSPATLNGTGADSQEIAVLPAASAPSNSPASGTIIIPGYADTTFNKVANCRFSYRYDSSSIQLPVAMQSLEWESTAAITQIDLKLASGNFVAGTKIRLYGRN